MDYNDQMTSIESASAMREDEDTMAPSLSAIRPLK